MSKYLPLWKHISVISQNEVTLSFNEIKEILSFDIDHSFLTYKKELEDFGWSVKKIYMKEKKVCFERKSNEI